MTLLPNPDAESWISKHASQMQSPFESVFVRQVLAYVPGVDFASLSAQHFFKDTDGGTRFCDFVISEGESLRIAIEIDGYDKTGRGTGMTHAEFVDWQRRHASLVNQGWTVIRFANHDVRHHSKRCIEHMSLLLKKERSKAGRLELLNAQEEVRLRQYEQAQQEIQQLKGDTRVMKTTVWAFAAIVVAMIYFTFGRTGEFKAQTPISVAVAAPVPSHVSAADKPPGQSCNEPLSWTKAGEHEGEIRAFSGTVTDVVSRPRSKGAPVFINIGEAYPSKRRLTAVIWSSEADIFQSRLQTGLAGRIICVLGEVSMRDSVAQIVLKKSSQLVY
jgi:very-short-patch-repair endonuclease